MACPSRRNSGFQASSTSLPAGASSRTRSASRSAVPTGTVDLPDDQAAPGEVRRQRAYGALDLAEVRGHRPGDLGRAGAEEVDVAERAGLGDVRGEPQPPGVERLAQHLRQPGLVERHPPDAKASTLGWSVS